MLINYVQILNRLVACVESRFFLNDGAKFGSFGGLCQLGCHELLKTTDGLCRMLQGAWAVESAWCFVRNQLQSVFLVCLYFETAYIKFFCGQAYKIKKNA